MAADVGDKTWTAVASSAASTGGGTSESDIKKYAEAGGAAAAAAACSGAGPAAAIGCGYVGGAVAGVLVDLGASLFGSSSPGLNDIYNPIADRIVARLVLLSRGKPADDAAIHALGEQGIRDMMKTAEWNAVAIQWAKAANAADAASGSPIRWWYDGKGDNGQPGRMRSAAIQQWVQLLAGGFFKGGSEATRASAQIPKGMVQAAATVAARNAPGADGVETVGGKSSGPGWGTLALALAVVAAIWKRKEIARVLKGETK